MNYVECSAYYISFTFHYRQLSVLGIALLILEYFFFDFSQPYSWILVAAVAICMLYQAKWILPYTPLYPVQVKSAEQDLRKTLRIMKDNRSSYLKAQNNQCSQSTIALRKRAVSTFMFGKSLGKAF
jgi:hypothetical protein